MSSSKPRWARCSPGFSWMVTARSASASSHGRDVGQRVVLDLDQRQGLLGGDRVLCDHAHHDLARVADLVTGDQRMVRHRMAVLEVDVREATAVTTASTPGQGAGGRRVDGADARVRVGRAHQARVGQARHADVDRVFRCAGDLGHAIATRHGHADGRGRLLALDDALAT